MKKTISLLLALVLCLSLTACGKSEAVKNVEAMIDALGEITLESIDAIRSTEDAYNALTEDEQKKVGNYKTLTEARDAYYKLALVGNWYSSEISLDVEANYENLGFVLNSDLSCTNYEYGNTSVGVWSVTDSILRTNFEEGWENSYIIQDVDGTISLQLEYSESGCTMMKEEDYFAFLNDVFLIVELSEVDLNDYFEITAYDNVVTNEWGDPSGDGYTSILLKNKLYEQGWMFLDKKNDYAIEILYPEYNITVQYNNGSSETSHHEAGSYTVDWYTPYTCTWQAAYYLDSYGTDYTATSDMSLDQVTFGRARGTFVFINSDYVVEVNKFDQDITNNRILVIDINGQTLTARSSEWVDGIDY